MELDLSDQIILVTGASRGIGRATAEALAEAGATVAVHYGHSEAAATEVAESCGPDARPVQADLSRVEPTDELIGRVIEHYGALHTVVLNAGVAVQAPLENDTETWHAAWTETMHVNLRAPELLCRHALRHFQSRSSSGGRIISVASRAAFRGDTPDYMTYAASKAGLVALTRSIARGFGDEGVKAFTIAPGFTRTDMAQDFIDEYGEDYATSDLALDRLTEPADVASLVVFLASGQADHATGTTLDVNAGSYVH
jgi:NAD(P)-dependent dehydrogenase (short-subunit alcohol dehydrogenase family)